MRLLIVDDDTLTRRVLARKLRAFGHEVSLRAGPEGAAVDAVVLRTGERDWRAPLSALAGAVHPPVILVAPQVGTRMRLAACRAGAFDAVGLRAPAGDWRRALAVLEHVTARERAFHARDDLRERIVREARAGLDAASRMQRALLPPVTRPLPGARAAWAFLPSTSVAGDLLGVHALDETRTAFHLLDVAGHGVPAAMFAFSLHRLLLPAQAGDVPFHAGALAAPQDLLGSPAELLMELNRQHQDDADIPRHFSIIYGVLDATRGLVRLAQAGLPAPLTQRGAVLLERSLPGPPVGLLPRALYDEIEFELRPGERLYLASDGVSECAGTAGTPFGEGRLREVLAAHRDRPLPQVVLGVEQALRAWVGDGAFRDDVSFLALEAA